MRFSYTKKRGSNSFAQRSVPMGRRVMVASSQRLATQTGLKVLAKGGNAIDAAVAMVCTSSVVEPHSTGIGGDAFTLMYLALEKKLIGMNTSGRAPYAADLSWFRERCMQEIPATGVLSVTVPGALHGWAEAIKRYGRLGLGNVSEYAIYYADNGFPVSEIIAGERQTAGEKLLSHPSSANFEASQNSGHT